MLYLILLPFSGAVIALLGKLAPGKRVFSVISVLPVGAMPVFLFPLLEFVRAGGQLETTIGNWSGPVAIVLQMDGLAWLSSALIVLVSIVVILASFAHNSYSSSYFFFLLVLIGGMQMVVLTNDIFTLFVGFEIVAIAAYVLIAYDQTDAGLLASIKYLLLSSAGILFFLLGVFLVYRHLGTLSLDQAALAIANGAGDSPAVRIAVAALCVGIGVRTAFIPFHTWLPEAHAYAPHPISALLSGVLIKVSFLAMLRVISIFSAGYYNEMLLWIGAATALVAVIFALSQKDAKRLLAYHSISQMGYIVAAFGAAAPLSLTAAFGHAANHALFKSLLFLVAGTAIWMGGSRNVFKNPPIGRKAPILAIGFLIGALSIAGIPPFNGFTSKALITASLAGSPAYPLLWITGVGTVASFIKMSRIVSPARTDAAIKSPGFIIHIPVVLLSLLCIAAGVAYRPLALFTSTLLGAESPYIPAAFETRKLMETLLVVGLGTALYFAIMSTGGKRVTGWIVRIAPELRTVLLFFLVGFVLFAAVGLAPLW
jgi:multicomponent Na+:H+ antiporter subunit D